jgi:hypothetical protein
MQEQQKKAQVAITQEQLILAVYEQLTAFNSDPGLTQEKATQLGTWCWQQLLHSQKQTRKHMERLIFLIDQMRTLQKEYWGGQRSKLDRAKVAESQVDNAVRVLLTELGYSIEEFKSKHEQTKLF